MSIFSLECFAFQTIRPVVSRKKRGFSAHFGPGGAVRRLRVSPFSKLKRSCVVCFPAGTGRMGGRPHGRRGDSSGRSVRPLWRQHSLPAFHLVECPCGRVGAARGSASPPPLCPSSTACRAVGMMGCRSMSSLKKAERAAAAQRRPAQSERKNRAFSAKQRAVWFGTRGLSN